MMETMLTQTSSVALCLTHCGIKARICIITNELAIALSGKKSDLEEKGHSHSLHNKFQFETGTELNKKILATNCCHTHARGAIQYYAFLCWDTDIYRKEQTVKLSYAIEFHVSFTIRTGCSGCMMSLDGSTSKALKPFFLHALHHPLLRWCDLYCLCSTVCTNTHGLHTAAAWWLRERGCTCMRWSYRRIPQCSVWTVSWCGPPESLQNKSNAFWFNQTIQHFQLFCIWFKHLERIT